MDYTKQKPSAEDNILEEPVAAYEVRRAPASIGSGFGAARRAAGKYDFDIYDPFYSKENQAELLRRVLDAENGKNLTPHELIEIEDE
jgi:hypothetical protein